MGRRTVCLALLLAGAASAQSAGKVSGRVTEGGSSEALPGVNLVVAELPGVGAVTDGDGRYTVLGLPPGRYTVVASMIGFGAVRVEGVEVFSGRTATVDVALREQAIQGQEVVVRAERPVITRDRTSSVSFIQQETIQQLPVQEVRDLVRFQPGVVEASGGFHIRGGRTREAAYLIDGVPVQDVFGQGGGSTVDVEVQSVQELQVVTGPFDAEYGGAQAGVVSVTTRDPGAAWAGAVRAQAGGYFAGEDRLGGGSDLWGTQDASLTLSGPLMRGVGLFVTARYEDRTGHLFGERRFTPEDGVELTAYRRWYRDRFQPDDTRLIALDTARAPDGALIRGRDGQPLTFASGDGAAVPMSWSRTLTLNPKLVARPFRGATLSYSALYSQSEGQGYTHSRRYAPDLRATGRAWSLLNVLAYRQAFGTTRLFSLRGSYKVGATSAIRFPDVADPRIQYLADGDDVTGFSFGATDNGAARGHAQQAFAATDFTWQVNPAHEAKVGASLLWSRQVTEDRDRSWVYRDASGNPTDSVFTNFAWPSAGAYPFFEDYLAEVQRRQPALVPELASVRVDDRFDHAPLEVAAFVQHKLEVDRRLVVKSGLRYERFAIGEDRLRDPRAQTSALGQPDNFTATPAKAYLSPRLGLSFPISASGAFRVAYGHFVQMPAYEQMLKNPVFAGINVGRLQGRAVGNPDLEPERTIKYELGLQQSLAPSVAVDVNLFYNNIRNLLGVELLTTTDNITYTRTVNRDYGLVRGGTFAVVLRPTGRLLSASLDVTYSDAKGSSSNPEAQAAQVTVGQAGEAGDFFIERNLIPLDWDQTLTLNAAATIGQGGVWSVGFVGQMGTGQPFTPGFLDPTRSFPDNAFDNRARKPLRLAFDVTAERRVRVRGAALGLRLQVDNLFNLRNETTVDAISGRAGQIVRLPLVQADRDRVLDTVGLFTAEEADFDPTWYSAPRRLLLGMTVTF